MPESATTHNTQQIRSPQDKTTHVTSHNPFYIEIVGLNDWLFPWRSHVARELEYTNTYTIGQKEATTKTFYCYPEFHVYKGNPQTKSILWLLFDLQRLFDYVTFRVHTISSRRPDCTHVTVCGRKGTFLSEILHEVLFCKSGFLPPIRGSGRTWQTCDVSNNLSCVGCPVFSGHWALFFLLLASNRWCTYMSSKTVQYQEV